MSIDRKSFLFIIFLGCQTMLTPLAIDMGLPALPATSEALAASPGATQWTLSAFVIGLAIAQLFVGTLADRFGRRPVLIASLAIFVLTSVGCTLAPSIGVLVAMRFAQGAGTCATGLVPRAMLRDLFEGREAAAKQSALFAIGPIAMLLAPMIGSGILLLLGWRAIYGVLGCVGLVTLIVTTLFLGETLRRTAQTRPKILASYRVVLGDPPTMVFCFVMAFVFAGFFAFVSGSPLVFEGFYGVSPAAYGLLFAVAASTTILGSVANGILARRMPGARLMRMDMALAGAAVMIVGLAAALHAPLPILISAIALFTFAAGMLMPITVALAMAALPQHAGIVSAMVSFLQFTIGGLSAAAIGWFRPGTPGGMVSVLAGFALCGLAIGAAFQFSARGRYVSPRPETIS